jgi:hypothetical protein
MSSSNHQALTTRSNLPNLGVSDNVRTEITLYIFLPFQDTSTPRLIYIKAVPPLTNTMLTQSTRAKNL